MIGSNICKMRKKKGLTLSELAARATISKSYLSNIERNQNNNPSIQIMERIAVALGTDLRTLIGTSQTAKQLPEIEWLNFVNELKKSGIQKEQLKELRTVIEFAEWQNSKRNQNCR